MSSSSFRGADDAALRAAAAARTLEARRALQAAKESLDNVGKANNVQLIISDSASTVSSNKETP